MPIATHYLKRAYRPVTVKAPLLEYRERQRIAVEIERRDLDLAVLKRDMEFRG
jgi:hypothetical protein